MKLSKSVIEKMDRNNPMPALYAHGLKPEQIKGLIFETFEPHLTDPSSYLKNDLSEALIADWINFIKFKQDANNFSNFEKCLEVYNSAKLENYEETISIYVDFMHDYSESLSKFWSFCKFEQEIEGLELEDLLHESLKLIGQMIEGVSKFYLKELTCLNNIARKKTYDPEKIKNSDLGVLVANLIDNTNFPDFFSPPPCNIRLGQWRNIAYHHNAKIENDKIVCWYGKAPNINQFEIRKSELLEVRRGIIDVCNTFIVSRTIFFADNYTAISKKVSEKKIKFKVREEASLLSLYSLLSAQQFQVIDASVTPDNARITIQDMTDGDKKQRAIHSSQFLFQLWYWTDSESLEIEYRLKCGTPFLISGTDSDVCKDISRGEKEISYLAEKVKFNFIK